MRAPKVRRWQVARRVVQYAALLAFLALFVGSRRGAWGPMVINIPMRLDPLAMLSSLLASRTLAAASALALLTVLLTLVFGRAWCGWLCPLGTLLDLFSPRKKKTVTFREGWRKAKYGLLIVLLVAALLGNLTLLIFDPLTLLFRSLSSSLFPALDKAVTAVETALYRIPWAQGAIGVFDPFIRPGFLPASPAYARFALLYTGVLAGVLLLNLAAPRFWCRALCPLGALLGLLSKAALFKRRVSPECNACGLCGHACPTGTIQPAPDLSSDPSECILCLECVDDCPQKATTFPAAPGLAAWQDYDPDRRQVLVSGGLTAAALAVAAAEPVGQQSHPYLIQPPGARENGLLSRCIRCGECSRACPTGAIQPALAEAGLTGLWTPVLVPRIGYCDYSCNACGAVCPVGAIPPLELAEKRLQVIGLARIDHNRCWAWADNIPCIVCEEMCPLPQKAITLKEPATPGGAALPVVDANLCIGCGICEYKCPASGDSAIRVYTP